MGRIRDYLLNTDTETAEKAKTSAYLRNEKTGLCYSIPVGRWTIGRSKDIDLDIPLKTDDKYISRKQAVIIIKKNHIGEYAMYIMDEMGKPNETRINGQKIYHSVEYQLYDGDVLRMGVTPITVHLWPQGRNYDTLKQAVKKTEENRTVKAQ